MRDTYAFGDLPVGINTIYGLQLSGYMAKSDTSTAYSKNALLTGGSLYYGATRTLGTSYTVYNDVFETDPATGAAWTNSGVNSAEAGMEVA